MNEDRFADTKLMRLQLCLYLLPVVGILPSLWQLRQPDQPGWADNQHHRQRRRLSHRSLQLTLGWLCLYLLFWGTGQGTGELAGFRLMYLNSLITTGYFLVCLLWMGRIFFQPLPSAKN